MAVSPLVLKSSIAGLGIVSVATTGIVFKDKLPFFHSQKNLKKEFDNLKINDCNFSQVKGDSGCSLNQENLKKIFQKFTEKTSLKDIDTTNTKLKITKIDGTEDDWKFVFTTDKNVFIKTDEQDNSPIIFKKGTPSEFRSTKNQGKYLLNEILSSDVYEKIVGFSDNCKQSSNSCEITKAELKKLNIFTDTDTKLDSLDVEIKENDVDESEKVVSLEWQKDPNAPKNFSSVFKFIIKSKLDGKTLKIKKDSSEIEIPKEGVNFWLKKDSDKYYLSRELTTAHKESQVGIDCSTNDNPGTCCKKTDGQLKIQEITGNITGTLNITKEKQTNNENIYKITNSGQTSVNGSYTIDYIGDAWTLIKIPAT